MGRNLDWKSYQEQIRQISALEYNYDDKVYHESKDKKGWNIDRYQAHLAVEGPGEPLAKGPFNAAKEVINLYKFPDPQLIQAVFDPSGELNGRSMLMFGYFMGLKFSFGVRVTKVIDEIRQNQTKQNVRVWGYSYRTLKGHFEVGEIKFELLKNLTTGEIDFEINAYSKPDRIPNFFYRVGFKIFGRSLQKYFATSSIERLQEIANENVKQLKGKIKS